MTRLFFSLALTGLTATLLSSCRSTATYPQSYGGSAVSKSPICETGPFFGNPFSGRAKRNLPASSSISGERYETVSENVFVDTATDPASTFSADVDTASYSNLRRLINDRQQVPFGAVRIEEMINYFSYHYPKSNSEHPLSISDEMSECPWNRENKLVRIALSSDTKPEKARKNANLVFLLDVSGSMDSPGKLPLLKKSFRLMLNNLKPEDRVAIVVYAGASGLVLPSTPCSDKKTILTALNQLEAGGSTAGGAGIELAYRTARENFDENSINRVILATDGDFNVGLQKDEELESLIEEKAKSGIFLSVLGFGMGNLNDSMLEKLSGKGNGNYAYIDTIGEARKVLVRELGSAVETVAKDVKLQVTFDPNQVSSYRLVGYENRLLSKEDFSDDKKDAGEVGAGHQVTAFYEIVPTHRNSSDSGIEVQVRYKQPDSQTSQLFSHSVSASSKRFEKAGKDFQFAASVAAFGMWLKNSPHGSRLSKSQILRWAKRSQGFDSYGYRAEFFDLVEKARTPPPSPTTTDT